MTPAPVPVAISACLLGEPVRWDGRHRRHGVLLRCLGPHVTWRPVCPEVEIGLGVPRPPIRIEREGAVERLVGIEDRRDHTAATARLARARLAALEAEGLAGWIFQGGSPSCGLAGVPVHDPAGRVVGAAPGAFAAWIRLARPALPVVEETALDDEAACAAFLERARAYSRSKGS